MLWQYAFLSIMPLLTCTYSLAFMDRDKVQRLLCWQDANPYINMCSPRGDNTRSWDVGDSDGFAVDVQAAAQFKACMRKHASEDRVCAVCGRYRPAHRVEITSFSQLPYNNLLRADGPKSDELPRHAHTTVQPTAGGSHYCKQPAGCIRFFP